MSSIAIEEELIKIASLRVLIVYHAAASFHQKKFCEALARQPGVELHVLGPRIVHDHMFVYEIPNRIEEGGYVLLPGELLGGGANYAALYRAGFLREIRDFKPDMIHVFQEVHSRLVLQALIYRNLFLPKARVVALGYQQIFPDDFFKRNWKRRIWRWFLNRYLDGATYANSEGIERYKQLGLTSPRMELMYWAVPDGLSGTESNTEILRKDLHLGDSFVLAYVGRIVREKGLDTVLMALTKLPTNVRFLIVGDGDYDEKLKNTAVHLGVESRMVWIGKVALEEVAKYLQISDALVVPSETTACWKEQFGNVIAEAMSCGIPVIGSDSGAIPEVIGNAGLIFRERDPDSLIDCVNQVLLDANLRTQLSRRGRERWQVTFSPEAFADRLKRFYLEGK